LSTRSSLPVVGASPVPYHPALTKRDAMPNEDHPTRPATVRRIAVAVFLAIVLLVILLGAC
jgi:hypothetical protein